MKIAPIEKELTRRQVENIYYSLQAVKFMPVSSAVRYSIARTMASLTPEIEATNAAYPRPTEPTNEFEWEKSRAEHMTGKVTIQVWPLLELPEIDAENLGQWRPGLTPVQLNFLHQDIVENLMVLLPSD